MTRVYNEFATPRELSEANGLTVNEIPAAAVEPSAPVMPKTELEKLQAAYLTQRAELLCRDEARCLTAYKRLADMTRTLMLSEAEEAARIVGKIGESPEEIPTLPEFIAECGYLDTAAIRKADVRRATSALERIESTEAKLSGLLTVLQKRRAEAEVLTGEDPVIKQQIADLERRRLDAALNGIEHDDLDAQIVELYQREEKRSRQGLFASGEILAIDEKAEFLHIALSAVLELKNKAMRIKIVFDACVAAEAFNTAAKTLAEEARAFEAVKKSAEALRGVTIRFPTTTVPGFKLMIPLLQYRWAVPDGNGGLQPSNRRDGFIYFNRL